ncbi:MAG: hypothetical protein ACYCSB_00830 [bacterium]
MRIGWLLKESTDKTNIQKNLSVFAAIVEQNLEYTLNLISTLEDPAVRYKNEDRADRLAKLKSNIKTELADYPPDEIIKIITFMSAIESVYSSTNEIKDYVKEIVKYPPVGFDFSEIAIKISDIAKQAIDGFFSEDVATELEAEIAETEMTLNAALRWLNELNGREKRERGRILYYAGIVALLREIKEKIRLAQLTKF